MLQIIEITVRTHKINEIGAIVDSAVTTGTNNVRV
jgi:uncharacterized protein YggE